MGSIPRKQAVWCVLLLALTLCGVASAADFILSGPEVKSVILMPQDSPGSEALIPAVEEFTGLLQQVTGREVPVVTEDDAAAAQVLRFEIKNDTNPATNDNFRFRFPDARTMVVECTPFSLQWALNRIAEDYAGVRFLLPEACGLSFEPMEEIAIPRVEAEFAPSFNLERSTYYSTPDWHKYQHLRSKLAFNHEIYTTVFPHGKYAQEGYPAQVLPEHNGKRLTQLPDNARPAQFWQPCYSNPDSATLAAANILAELRKNPGKVSVSLTINDNGGFCQCAACRAANGGDKGYDHSEVYFKWVNQVAEIVTKEFPDVLLPALAYAEVLNPPSFAIHPNVPIMICLDLYANTDPAIKAKHLKMIEEWSQKASTLGVWDYAWGYSYVPPRMYLHMQVEMMRYLYEHGARAYFLEYECMDGKEGPKPYLYAKLLWDINADVDALLTEWYVRCVGPEAAPYLREYYEKWEAYFAGPEVRQTPWFASARYVYMTWGAPSHADGLKVGEVASFRPLMEQVVALAQTDQQKARAELLMRRFEGVEAVLMLNGAEPIPPDGNISTPSQALELIANVAQAPHYLEQLKRVALETKQEPFTGTRMFDDLLGNMLKGDKDTALLNQLCLAAKFAAEPEVAAAFAALGQRRDLPEVVTATARYFAGAENARGNLIAGGDMESGAESIFTNGVGVVDGEVAASGKSSVKIIPERLVHALKVTAAEPNSIYLLTFKVFIPQCGSEAYMRNTLFAADKGDLCQWWEVSKTFIPAGSWQSFAMTGTTPDNGNELHLNLEFGNFNPGESVFIDDLTLVKIGSSVKVPDALTGPVAPAAPEGFSGLPLVFAVNDGIADDAKVALHTYPDGVETLKLAGSRSKSLSHFFSQAANIDAPAGAQVEFLIYGRGKGRLLFGCYSYDVDGKFLGTATDSIGLGSDLEAVSAVITPTPAPTGAERYQIRPMMGFSSPNGQAEIAAVYYRILPRP